MCPIRSAVTSRREHVTSRVSPGDHVKNRHLLFLESELSQPLLQMPPLGLVTHQLEGAPVRFGGLSVAAEPAQQLRVRGGQQVIPGELAAAVDVIHHGEAALDLAKAGRIPDVRLGAGTRWDDQTDDRGYLVELELALPIFDRKQGEIREACHEMDRARAGRSAAEAAKTAEIAEVFARLDESRVTSETLGQQVVPAARATFEALRMGFEETARNLSDLIDARRDLARAEVDYTDALVAHHVARATLESLVGSSLTGGE